MPIDRHHTIFVRSTLNFLNLERHCPVTDFEKFGSKQDKWTLSGTVYGKNASSIWNSCDMYTPYPGADGMLLDKNGKKIIGEWKSWKWRILWIIDHCWVFFSVGEESLQSSISNKDPRWQTPYQFYFPFRWIKKVWYSCIILKEMRL